MRGAAGPGLLNFIYLNEIQIHSLELLLLSVALGSFLGNLTLGRFFPLQNTFRIFGSIARGSRIVKWVGSFSVLIAYFAEGTNILYRESYLGSNGVAVMARISGAILLPSLCLIIFLMVKGPKGSGNLPNYLIVTLGFLLLLGKGSRAGIVLFLFFLLLFLNSGYSRKSKVLVIILSPLLTYFLFGLVVESRISPHGIIMVPQNMMDALGTLNFFYLFKFAIALALSWIIVVPLSLGTVTGDRLLQNLNPLLSSGVNPFDFGAGGTERLYPYRWVPASSAGQIYEIIGFIGMLLLFYALTLIVQGCLLLKRHEKTLSFSQLSILGFYFFQFPIFLQYSSRNWFRVISIMFLVVFISLLPQNRNNSNKKEVEDA